MNIYKGTQAPSHHQQVHQNIPNDRANVDSRASSEQRAVGDVRSITRSTYTLGIEHNDKHRKEDEDQEAKQWDQARVSQGKYRAITRYATANSEEIYKQARDGAECPYCGSERHKGIDCNLTWIIRDGRGQETPVLSVYKLGQVKYLTPEGYEAQINKARTEGLLKEMTEEEYKGFCKMVEERETAIKEREIQSRQANQGSGYQGGRTGGRGYGNYGGTQQGRGFGQGRGTFSQHGGGRGGSSYSAYNPSTRL
jgi:hypothetical protein